MLHSTLAFPAVEAHGQAIGIPLALQRDIIVSTSCMTIIDWGVVVFVLCRGGGWVRLADLGGEGLNSDDDHNKQMEIWTNLSSHVDRWRMSVYSKVVGG